MMKFGSGTLLVSIALSAAGCSGGPPAATAGPADAGGPLILASSQSHPSGIAVDSTSVYWTDEVAASGAVMKAPLAGGAATTLASGQGSPYALVVDHTSAYWTDNIGVCPAGGGVCG